MANIKLGNDTLTGVDTLKVTNADDETQKVNYRAEIVSTFQVDSSTFTVQFTVGETWEDIVNRDDRFKIVSGFVKVVTGIMEQNLVYPGSFFNVSMGHYVSNISYSAIK